MKPLRELVLNCISTEEVVHPVLLVDKVPFEWFERFQGCFVLVWMLVWVWWRVVVKPKIQLKKSQQDYSVRSVACWFLEMLCLSFLHSTGLRTQTGTLAFFIHSSFGGPRHCVCDLFQLQRLPQQTPSISQLSLTFCLAEKGKIRQSIVY